MSSNSLPNEGSPPGSPTSDFYDSVDNFVDDDAPGIGLSSPEVNHGIRKKLDAINKLHSTGVQVDIDLPQIAVIGNQSAGKSSLIESISGITLPRASGTCTRCPTECRLSRSNAKWQCIVSLRYTTDANGQPLGQVRNERFGEVIYDKEKVEERIRRAQLAILNPGKSPKLFLELEDPKTLIGHNNQKWFSSDCITLHISGPDVADLSFCDLPGLIASAGSSRGGENSVALVENLVTAHIKKPSCIILLTVACETDFENQGAHRLAKQFDPDGKRTIGVLTKPDRIPTGDEPLWLPFIRNEKEPLENNWFCVKQPSSNELAQSKGKMTWTRARQLERNYFSSAEPWSELEAMYQKCLGTGHLVKQLSAILADLIGMRMPQIQDELDRSILSTRNLISRLPPPPSSDARSEILTMLHSFTNHLGQHIQGVPDGMVIDSAPGLIQSILPLQQKFRLAIRSSAPNFVPFEKDASAGKELPEADFLAAEDGDWTVMDRILLASGKRIYVDEVLERAKRARTRELPGHYPFVVQKTYIEQLVQEWHAPSIVLCNEVHKIMTEHVKKLVHKHFASYGQGLLEQRVRAILQQHVNKCLDRADERVKWLQQLEDVPFSNNNHYLADYRTKFFALYRGARNNYAQQDLSKMKFVTQSHSVNSTPPAPGPMFGPNNSPFDNLPPPPLGSNTFFSTKPSSTTQTSGFPRGPSTPAPATAYPFRSHLNPSSAPSTPPVSSSTEPQNSTARAESVNKALGALAEIGLPGLKAEDLAKLLPPDVMEPALGIMADVRAYFQVAYKRFADNVPLAVDLELVRGVEKNILPILYANLGINGPKGDIICKELAQENRKIADRRADLQKKLERLESARVELFAAAV